MDNETARFLSTAWAVAFIFFSMVTNEIFREPLEGWYNGSTLLDSLLILTYGVLWVTVIVGGAQWLYLKVLLPKVIKNEGARKNG